MIIEETDKRPPYPISWPEQDLLFGEMTGHLRALATFAVNTGARDQEILNLRWDWEMSVPELRRSAFIIPAQYSKNKIDGLIFLIRRAQSVVDDQRNLHKIWVFPSPKGGKYYQMCGTTWQRGRKRAALRYEAELDAPCPDRFRMVKPHDMRHTFGQRLRAAGISTEDRTDLLRHKKRDVTSHYSLAELSHMFDCVDRIDKPKAGGRPALLLVRRQRQPR